MTQPSPWADYLDARLRLVQQWADEGHDVAEIIGKLQVDARQIELLLQTPTEPPIPGCSRDLADQWRTRAQAAERALHATSETSSPATLPSRPPMMTDIRELAPKEPEE